MTDQQKDVVGELTERLLKTEKFLYRRGFLTCAKDMLDAREALSTQSAQLKKMREVLKEIADNPDCQYANCGIAASAALANTGD